MAKMTTQEIIAKSVGRTGQDPQKVHAAMTQLATTDPKFRIMRSGNTLFSYYNLGNGTVDVAMDTAATPRELVKDVKEFAKAMKVAKFRQGRFSMNNPQIEKVLKMAGLQYKLMPLPNGMMSAVVEV
jgi:hypothetical protein